VSYARIAQDAGDTDNHGSNEDDQANDDEHPLPPEASVNDYCERRCDD
jgi:hypothetical protein